MDDKHPADSLSPAPATQPWAQPTEPLLDQLGSSLHGLPSEAAETRLAQHGRNRLPTAKPPSLSRIVLRQFASPLIYVLLAAAALSAMIGEWSDAGFIAGVLLLNALIGTLQERSAQNAAIALHQLVSARARVLRGGESHDIDAETLVPGDLVLLESGDRVPADIRLLSCHDLDIDESLLTGESAAVSKSAIDQLPADTALAERKNMAFAGSLVQRGRATGLVTATALDTELGRIAAAVIGTPPAKAPLLLRMEVFTRRVAMAVGIAAALLMVVSLYRGAAFDEVFLLAVALAVSAIPEGLPVALTVALAIGMRRMAKRQVIIRRLVAVEALGSCTFIATDKTGTLTENRLSVRLIALPDGAQWQVTATADSDEPSGTVLCNDDELNDAQTALLSRVCQAAVLANDGFLGRRNGGWAQHGDAVDVALLVMAHKAGVVRAQRLNATPELATIPFESALMFSASLNAAGDGKLAFVKGALERLLPMCTMMAGVDGDRPIDPPALEAQMQLLATQGYRVLALAGGPVADSSDGNFGESQLRGLTLLGLIGLIDPLRAGAGEAVASCRAAGIEVAMLTGDHPATAFAIGRELGIVDDPAQVVTGAALREAQHSGDIAALTGRARVYARVEPQQKLDIVHALRDQGHFVAVSGDGANDAPAMRAAQVAVAMGRGGTDVARESADLVIADDDFCSIVAGVEEGRVAYANVRKVIFLLISTGAAELVLFALALFTGQPLPLLAVQLLWLNLVTNGIQDVALAFEPAEGGELRRPPRSPREAIFNRLMLERVLISAVVMGGVAFALFNWLLAQGWSVDAARNGTLLLMVLFENIHVFNCRSETRLAVCSNPLRNRILLAGTVLAQLIHIGAMYTPGLSDVLALQPVSLEDWSTLLLLATSVLVAMELHKWLWATRQNRIRRRRGAPT